MCDDCKNGHCHSCHREIVGADHHESDGVYCEPCATYRNRIASLEAERDRLREMVRKLIPWTGACPDYFSDKDDCGKCEHCITRREAENYIAASIGGEEKP